MQACAAEAGALQVQLAGQRAALGESCAAAEVDRAAAEAARLEASAAARQAAEAAAAERELSQRQLEAASAEVQGLQREVRLFTKACGNIRLGAPARVMLGVAAWHHSGGVRQEDSPAQAGTR